MKKILIKNIVTKRFGEEKITKIDRLKSINFKKEKNNREEKQD